MDDIEKLKEEIAELKEQVKWLKGCVGINSNGLQYLEHRYNDMRDVTKLAYDFLCSRDEFRDFFAVKKTIEDME